MYATLRIYAKHALELIQRRIDISLIGTKRLMRRALLMQVVLELRHALFFVRAD